MNAAALAARRSAWPHVLVWAPTLLLVALWSLLAWAGHRLASWSGWGTSVPGETDAWQDWAGAGPLSGLLEPWLPPGALEALQGATLATWQPLVEWLGSLGADLLAWLPTLVLVLWVAGIAFLLFAAAVASVAIGLLRRRIPA